MDAADRAFGLLAFQVNRHLVDHMLRLSRAFSLGFEEIMLWGVLSHQNVAHLLPPGAAPASVLDEHGNPQAHGGAALRPLRVRDLVQITGLPRETVRRKLATLEQRGLVKKLDSSGWIMVREAITGETRAFTLETVRRLLETANAVQQTLDAARQGSD
ncbi:MAG: helix-turn-helix domain-containing protein [Pseudomonadales bacterium]|nr:helix-turn-helix domain-containing protein [Pseudomonadales bacterium]